MSFSQMSSKEKTIVAVLAVVIVLALGGIGVLGYQLISNVGEPQAEISVDNSTSAAPIAAPTVTEMPPLALEDLAEPPAITTGSEPVQVARQESVGPLAPAMIANHPLSAGHSYRVEITTKDGSMTPITGQWSQSATSASGKVAAPQIKFFKGTTPHTITVTAPVPDPSIWGIQISAGPEGLGAKSPVVITIWDVTGTQ